MSSNDEGGDRRRPPPVVPLDDDAAVAAPPSSSSSSPEEIPSAAAASSSRASRIVECSEQDDRSYRTLALPNGLKCLLISDPTTDKASAALDVRVGHLSDPDDVPGLAHFLEHMLFMGTKKYPDENSYNAFLNGHGGSSNAFTDMESTNYYFDVSSDELEGALDRFSQFFVSPLFAPNAIEREMRAVDSEHAKNLQSDYWRMFQLTKSLCREGHPFRKFGSGNLETLRGVRGGKGDGEGEGEGEGEEGGDDDDKLRKSLMDFHEKYYSSNLMKLVVLGKESLDALGELVRRCFSDVADRNLDPPAFPGEPFGPSQLAKRLRVVPVSETRSIELHFPMREIDSLYLAKPTRYLSHLIGHEGSGSILSSLKERGWANELSAGESRSCSDWSSFSISVELTDEGLERSDDVVEIVFSYLSMLRSVGPQLWIHEETSAVASCSFRFLSKRDPIDYTCSLAGAMQLYPDEHVLSGPYKIYEYDRSCIEECMSYLTPSNMLLASVAKKFEGRTTLKERWYGTEYDAEDIPAELLRRWEEAGADSEPAGGGKEGKKLLLRLPDENDMIATDFALREARGVPKDEPRLLVDDERCRLWYKPDNVFQMPKINAMAMIQTPTAYESPESSVLAFLWANVLQEHCNEFTYLASMAGLHCAFSNARKGIEIHVSGYNHKANVLMKRIIEKAIALPAELKEDLFERIKDKVSKQYQNFLFSQPYNHAFYGADLCLEEMKWSMEDKMTALDGIGQADLIDFSRRLLSRFHAEMLVHGNCSPSEAKEICATVLDGLDPSPPFRSNRPLLRVVRLEAGSECAYRFPEYNEENTNGCVENVYQVGPVSLPTNATLALLHHLVKEPAFNELRTEEQLGYIVHTSVKTSGDDVKGLVFLIQSDSFDPTHLDARIEAFLERFRAKMIDMSPEEFRMNANAVVNNFLEKNKNLGEESSKYWTVITDGSYIFKKFQRLGKEVGKLEMDQVVAFFDEYIAKGAPSRRKLSAQVFAKNHMDRIDDVVEEGVTLISADDVIEFKRTMPLFPLPKKVDVESMMME